MSTVNALTAVLGLALMTCSLIGLGARFLLLPWLRENIAKPVAETNKQVTENSHANLKPTLPDQFDDVKQQYVALLEAVDALRSAVEGINERLHEHLAWSHEETNRLWHAIVTKYSGPAPAPRQPDQH